MSSKNSIVSIHNPTLRFLAKWLAMVVHSCTDLHLCSLPELQCLYAMANKIRFSPVRSMLSHWQKMIMAKGPIDITPLVTRVARYVKAMDGAEVTFCNTRFIKEHKPSNHIRARIKSHVYTTE